MTVGKSKSNWLKCLKILNHHGSNVGKCCSIKTELISDFSFSQLISVTPQRDWLCCWECPWPIINCDIEEDLFGWSGRESCSSTRSCSLHGRVSDRAICLFVWDECEQNSSLSKSTVKPWITLACMQKSENTTLLPRERLWTSGFIRETSQSSEKFSTVNVAL